MIFTLAGTSSLDACLLQGSCPREAPGDLSRDSTDLTGPSAAMDHAPCSGQWLTPLLKV